MAHSELQKLQKSRAFFKYVITGLFKPVNTNYLTEYEVSLWNEILEIRKKLILIHNGNSRELGLDVPVNRCYVEKCRKEGTHLTEIGKFCSKHYEEITEREI